MLAPSENWSRAGVEPRLEDLINDPIARLVMRRDKLVPADLLKAVARARARLCKPRRITTGARTRTAGAVSCQDADA